jgi:formamidopyrimidine-DNA glycosylase
MPEGPEAAYCASVIAALQGRSLTGVDILKGRYVKHGPPANYAAFVKALPLPLTSVYKKGKVLFLEFGPWTIISRLGLTGWWYTTAAPSWRKEVQSLVFQFDGAHLTYSDPLSYGTLTFTTDRAVVQEALDELAPDVTDPHTTLAIFKARLPKATGTKAVEELIVDQHRLLSGIGNYMKAEVLYEAGIAPMRKAATMTEQDWAAVFKAAKKVAARILKVLDTDLDGYDDAMAVYGKKEDPEGRPVETYVNGQKRKTYWVPGKQV